MVPHCYPRESAPSTENHDLPSFHPPPLRPHVGPSPIASSFQSSLFSPLCFFFSHISFSSVILRCLPSLAAPCPLLCSRPTAVSQGPPFRSGRRSTLGVFLHLETKSSLQKPLRALSALGLYALFNLISGDLTISKSHGA